MKRARSFMEGQESGGTGSISRSSAPSPSYQQTNPSMDAMSMRQIPHKSEKGRDSVDTSSRPSWPCEQRTGEMHEGRSIPSASVVKEETSAIQTVVHRVVGSDQITLKDIACDPIESVAEILNVLPDEECEKLKSELREILNAVGGITQKGDFSVLQSWLLNRRDILPDILSRSNRTQLQVLVALKTGIQAFLHPDISITPSVLVEVFFNKRCRNMACQCQLPGDDCECEVCTTKSGFCNVCMCTICSKFDFDVNTCRWIGCDACSHWTHTDCAIRVRQIAMGVSLRRGRGSSPEMLFNCRACKHTSELLGWVKDVFHTCAGDWNTEELMKEFDSVHRIFQGAEDSKGRELFWKSEELLQKLKNGGDNATVCSEMQQFFQELEGEDVEQYKGENAKMVEPQEACNRIADVVQEAVAKMEIVAQEKSRALKRARTALETCDKELEEKKRELQDMQLERQKKKQEIEELETIVKLRLAESEMFQMRADDARQAAENLQRLVADRSEKAEEEYTTRYLQLRLNEVEAERRALFEKIQLQEHARASSQPNSSSQMAMMDKIHDLLKQVCSPKKDGTTTKEMSVA